MNDQVETIYKQMFAPHPIPQSVLDLYKRAKFLADRIDNPNITVGGLVLIAATATGSAKTSVSNTPEEIDETLTTQTDADVHDTAPQTAAETLSATGAMDAPLGKMDAPTKPETDLQRGMSIKRLMKLTAPELRAHAKEFYGLDAKKTWGKKKIAHAIHTMSPTKPGAMAKHPSEVKKNG